MFGRIVAVGAISIGMIAVFPAISNAAAIHVNPPGVGITTCPDDGGGTVTFTPPLSNAGTSSSEVVNLEATGKPCSGGSPTPHSFTLKLIESVTGTDVNLCSDFFALVPPGTVTFPVPVTGSIAWGAPITASHVTSGTLKSKETTLTAPVKLKGSHLAVTVSYPTTTGSFTYSSAISAGTILGDCSSSTGLSGFDLSTTSGGTGTF
jgi:hypothetical protein